MKRVLAFDLGASGGRAILGEYENRKLRLEEVSRFSYEPLIINKKMHWDISRIFTEIKNAIAKVSANHHIDSLAIDTWGVDYGLLDEEGELLEAPVHYRDSRTTGMLKEVTKLIPKETLYHQSGNQLMEINTLFQLKAMALQDSQKFAQAHTFLLMPDLLNYLLTSQKKTEMSIASTTQLLDPRKKQWNRTLIKQLNLPQHLFTEIVTEGQELGKIRPDLNLASIPVYHICAHDTASAYVSGAKEEDGFFVSCGTWSVVGVERETPIINEKARHYNLTNEIGIGGSTRLLKNIPGLWIIQELKREFAKQDRIYTYSELETLAKDARPFQFFIDTEDPRFLPAGPMVNRIHAFLQESNQELPQMDGELIRLVYESLAFKYQVTFLEIMDVVKKSYSSVNIVGGGAQSELLCEMVANASGLVVFAGPVEATALGNISVQLMSHGCFASLEEVRAWIGEIADIKRYEPSMKMEWEQQFERYKKLMRRKRK